jgi:hypothetical protein
VYTKSKVNPNNRSRDGNTRCVSMTPTRLDSERDLDHNLQILFEQFVFKNRDEEL